MFIQTESTPNPATLKFLPGQTVLDLGTADFPSAEAAEKSPLARRIFGAGGVTGVFFGTDFVTVTKADSANWDHVKPAILGAIMEHYQSGAPVIEGEQAASGHKVHDGPGWRYRSPDQGIARHPRASRRGAGRRRHHLPRFRPRRGLSAHAGRLRGLPVLDPDAEDGDREPAAGITSPRWSRFGPLPPEPYVLAFDTSAAHCAAALLCADRLVAEVWEPMEKGQAEALMPLLEGLLARAGIAWRDLAALGVGTGPGNFTGVRISVAAARGLALGLGIPAVGVTGFEAVGYGLPEDTLLTLDARRGALWLAGKGVTAGQVTLDTLPEGIAGRAVAGHRAEEVAASIGGRAVAQPVGLAEAIARIAARRMGTPQPRPAPLYLRGADAALPSEPPLVILP